MKLRILLHTLLRYLSTGTMNMRQRLPEPKLALLLLCLGFVAIPSLLWAEESAKRDIWPDSAQVLKPMDIFDLEWVSDPRISPDGSRVVYTRGFMDVMQDRRRSNLWLARSDGSGQRPLTSGLGNDHSPRWSPDGKKLLYVSSTEKGSQLFLRYMDSGESFQITHLQQSPGGLAWSPDGRWIALAMEVPQEAEPLAKMPSKPEGAEWAEPPRVIESMIYRADGQGYLRESTRHLFLLPAEGGTPRQLTQGDRDFDGTPSWSADGRFLITSANLEDDHELDPQDSEVYEISIETGAVRPLTDRQGPDFAPVVSPDGSQIAYLGYDDREQGHQRTALYIMDRDGSGPRMLTDALDRSVASPRWAGDSQSLVFQYNDQGNGKIGRVGLDGKVSTLAGDVGGVSLGRPYSSGSFSLARDGRYAFTHTRPDHPADLAVGKGQEVRRLTQVNQDLLAHKRLGEVEEIRFPSSHDEREIQGWVVRPPDFDPAKKYPMIMEIHGGPFANYGDRFSAECQLFASAGYVVLYINPRGSTSYGEEFGNLIHHAYPGNDYDDLMSGVDHLLAKGYVDPERLYVTGGSGGGVLTAWIVGKTDRFRAAVSAKPVINWYSFALTSDFYNFFYRYWFPGFPWDHPEQYHDRSPLSLVGNVKTPTMLLTGEADYRTPMSESEQYYQALKLLQVDTALVRIPEASHSITARPSRLIAKVAHILGWFERYGGGE